MDLAKTFWSHRINNLHSCSTYEDIEATLIVTEKCEDPGHLMEVLWYSCVGIPLPKESASHNDLHLPKSINNPDNSPKQAEGPT